MTWPAFYADALDELLAGDLRRGHIVQYPHVAVVNPDGEKSRWSCCCKSGAGRTGFDTAKAAFAAADRHVAYSRPRTPDAVTPRDSDAAS